MRLTPLLIALLVASPVLRAHEAGAPASRTDAALAPDAVAPAATVDAFAAALKAGRLDEVKALLDPQVQVYESGHVESGRDAYFAEHAAADAAFLATADIVREGRSVEVSGDVAWVGTRSTLRRDGKRYASLESMVLRRGADGWKIVHIHWSSRPLAAP